MTKTEQRQQIKHTAFNKIRKMYHPLTKGSYTHYPDEGSTDEQMSEDVRRIMRKMEKDLNELRFK